MIPRQGGHPFRRMVATQSERSDEGVFMVTPGSLLKSTLFFS